MQSFELKEMFERQGFALVTQPKSESFNSRLVFSTPGLLVVAIDDRGIRYIEIASPMDPARSYDMTLVKTLLSGEDFLLEQPDLEDEFQFVVHNLDRLKDVFSKRKYDSTIESLGKLELERAKRMFPGWY